MQKKFGARAIATLRLIWARAVTLTEERTRQGMLEAANVWDRLADLVDRPVNLFGKSIPPERCARS